MQIAGWYTRLMRDEVLAEWQAGEPPVLHVHCHVSGGLVVGTAGWRASIFRQHMPMVLEAFWRGDQGLLAGFPAGCPGERSWCTFMPGRSGWPQSSRGGFSGTTGRRFFRKSAPHNEQNLSQFNQSRILFLYDIYNRRCTSASIALPSFGFTRKGKIMKPIPILLVFILLLLPFQPAQADGEDTVTLTADQVSGAMDIELAIARATADGTRPGTLILDGAAGAFVFTSDDRSINIAVSNLQLLGANFAVIENCADGLFFDDVPGGNVLVEGISFICDGGGVAGLTPFERVVLRGNYFQVGGMGITIHGTPSHWTISGNKFTAGGVGAAASAWSSTAAAASS